MNQKYTYAQQLVDKFRHYRLEIGLYGYVDDVVSTTGYLVDVIQMGDDDLDFLIGIADDPTRLEENEVVYRHWHNVEYIKKLPN